MPISAPSIEMSLVTWWIAAKIRDTQNPMIGKFKVTLSRGGQSASHVLIYCENESPRVATSHGDAASFTRKDGSAVTFAGVHMDKLAFTAQEWAEEIGAEALVEELTGSDPADEV